MRSSHESCIILINVSLIPGKGHDSRRVGVNCFLLFVIVLFF